MTELSVEVHFSMVVLLAFVAEVPALLVLRSRRGRGR